MARKKNQRRRSSSSDFHRRNGVDTKIPKTILVVTEGFNTEPQYFTTLAGVWQLHTHVMTLKPGGEGIPLNLVKKAKREIKDREKALKRGELPLNQTKNFDEVWIVFDTEHAERQNKLHDGIDAAKSEGFKIAYTSPCIEFWLALHFELRAKPMNTCDEACRLLEEVSPDDLGSYSKKNGPGQDFINKLIDKVGDAVKNAETVAQNNKDESFPANPATSVQKLVRSMHESLPQALQDRFPLPAEPLADVTT